MLILLANLAQGYGGVCGKVHVEIYVKNYVKIMCIHTHT